MTWLILTLAGAVGAVARYALSGWIQRRTTATVPTGTFVVNLLGAFALGSVAARGGQALASTVAAGFLGGFTTFSTWMVESWALAGGGTRGRRLALGNLAATLALGVVAAALGYGMAT